MKDKRSEVSGSSNRTRGNKDGRREDKRCFELTNSKRSQGHTKVFRIGKLLSLIH